MQKYLIMIISMGIKFLSEIYIYSTVQYILYTYSKQAHTWKY